MIPHVIATKKESFFEELWAMMGRRDWELVYVLKMRVFMSLFAL